MPESQHLKNVLKHKHQVGNYMNKFSSELFHRAVVHDYSKFSEEEFDLFEKSTPKLAGLTYGSQEYKDALREIEPAIKHHYLVNTHHPEHFPNGIDGMNLMDVVEMVCDWIAAVKRHNDGDIYKSLEINKKRFNIDEQLYSIIKNTVDHFESK